VKGLVNNNFINDRKYMEHAIKQAKKAGAIEEVPIGCIIVYKDKIIARGYNKRNSKKNTLFHAEIEAINKASKKIGDWRLEDCTMYITLEPCPMCAGAIVQARMKRVVIGAMNPKAGCAGSIINLFDIDKFNHKVEVETGIRGDECGNLLKEFFSNLRKKKSEVKSE
jgi:tRNA(adenine34) deaminase